MTALEATHIKPVKGWQFGMDLVQQVAVIRTVFHDGTTQETPIPRAQLKQTIEYLQTSLKEFERQDSQSKQ